MILFSGGGNSELEPMSEEQQKRLSMSYGKDEFYENEFDSEGLSTAKSKASEPAKSPKPAQAEAAPDVVQEDEGGDMDFLSDDANSVAMDNSTLVPKFVRGGQAKGSGSGTLKITGGRKTVQFQDDDDDDDEIREALEALNNPQQVIFPLFVIFFQFYEKKFTVVWIGVGREIGFNSKVKHYIS